ncbi:hypothetical protein TKK_0011984 [Trichogramma kaykai]
MRSWIVLVGSLLQLAPSIDGQWHDEAGPWFEATLGEPWPIPVSRQVHELYACLDVDSFNFHIVDKSCDILLDAVKRYGKIIETEAKTAKWKVEDGEDLLVCDNYLRKLEINLQLECEQYPRLDSNESYYLSVLEKSKSSACLEADSIWGILRGLETFSQLLASPRNSSKLMIKSQAIRDYPKMAHRGLLLDTSRHYMPLSVILSTLDAMAYNKLNVFHWHIVDDNSFPYVSSTYPELSRRGAYHRSMLYTAEDVAKVVEHARYRAIRVVPEFDTPGHTRSWGQAYPHLLTTCYDRKKQPTGKLGPMNPSKPEVYDFMRNLLREISERFVDDHFHLGGDEVPFQCWQSNPGVNNFMERHNISSRYDKLEEMYVKRVLGMCEELRLKSIVWQEVFDNGVDLPKDSVVQVWTGNWREEMAKITAAGHPVLLSACWYMSELASGGDWLKFYDCDPLNFLASSKEHKKLVIGGEACMWGEFVDKNNVQQRIWPRASAVAERLWSRKRNGPETAAKRLEEHACRMNRRGIPAQPPNGSGYCLTLPQ